MRQRFSSTPTPPLIYLHNHKEADTRNLETPNSRQSPEVKSIHKNTGPATTVDRRPKEPTPNKNPTKTTGTAKRKSSAPMKLPPPRKLPDTLSRYNTRPMRSRQPPTMLGERVFTSLVETADDKPGEHVSSQVYTPPYISSIEAITTELDSHQIDLVETTSPSTSSPWHPTVVNLSEGGSEQTSYTKPSSLLSPIGSPRKVQFSPEVHKSEYHRSRRPSEPVEATTTPIGFNPYWLNTPSIISTMELLGRPTTLDELRRWTVNRATNRDAA